MYAWGGDTRDLKGKKSYDYGSARAKYDARAKAAGLTGSRSYSRKIAPDDSLTNAFNKVISSYSSDPIVIGVDVTGSMSSWPGEIFDRLPLLYQTLAKYKPDVEFSFCAIGDANCDNYPLQVTDFTKDMKELEERVKALGCEGGGGGHITESYELFGYYMLKNCKTPNATNPFLIIYGDETFYDDVNPKQVKQFIGSNLQKRMDSKDMWQKLLQKFNVYYLQKPYSGVTDQVKEKWAEAIGPQRVIALPSMERSVDIAMGLIAKHWGEYNDFNKSLDARHDDPAIKASVKRSLRNIDATPAVTSMLKLPAPSVSKKTRSLLD